MKNTIIHLSDLHIGHMEKESVRSDRLVEAVAQRYKGCPVLITGDLVESGKKSQFREARALLDKLARTNPVLAVPGNHDYAWHGNILDKDAWGHWVEYLGSPLGWKAKSDYWTGPDEPMKFEGLGIWMDEQNPNIVYFGIDSGDPEDYEITARGYVSEALVDKLRPALEAKKDKTRVVMLHHHVLMRGLFMALHGAEYLMENLAGNCELLIFGHKHDYGIWDNYGGIKLMVSSHKSTDCISGECLAVTVFDIENTGPAASISHRLEIFNI